MAENGHKGEKPRLRVSILGTRGIPASYGGFETFAEMLSLRLVQRGHAVTVYGRRPFGKKLPAQGTYQGVFIRLVPTIMHKYLETLVHSFLSLIDLCFQPCDVAILCNAANSPFAWIARLRGIPVAINVDGIERKRSKWNSFGKLWYRLGEICSVLFASRVIADADVIAAYYRKRFGIEPTVICYGATPIEREPAETLAKFGLKPGKYLLYVSRLEPENNALGVIEAYNQITTEMPLVIVGDAPYATEYIAQLKATAGAGVIFTGYQFNQAYQELRNHCYLYVQATEVGGTHPALVEAMAYGNCVVANATPEHIEVLRDTGVYYEKNDFSKLGERLKELIANPERVRALGSAARQRAKEIYSWDKITDQYEDLLIELGR